MCERGLDYKALVDYLVRRWAESEAGARRTAAQLERNLGLEKAQRETRP